jgi:hypothetical protein
MMMHGLANVKLGRSRRGDHTEEGVGKKACVFRLDSVA